MSPNPNQPHQNHSHLPNPLQKQRPLQYLQWVLFNAPGVCRSVPLASFTDDQPSTSELPQKETMMQWKMPNPKLMPRLALLPNKTRPVFQRLRTRRQRLAKQTKRRKVAV